MTYDDERLKIKETVNEDGTLSIEVKCEKSGRPLTRTTKLGMFCDDPNCVCEKESEETFAMIKDLFGER